ETEVAAHHMPLAPLSRQGTPGARGQRLRPDEVAAWSRITFPKRDTSRARTRYLQTQPVPPRAAPTVGPHRCPLGRGESRRAWLRLGPRTSRQVREPGSRSDHRFG